MAKANTRWAKIIAKAWSNEEFKQRLLKDPMAVCDEFGFQLPPGTTLHIHENTDTEIHAALPLKPAGELSEEKLETIAGGIPSPMEPCGVMG